jgi:CHAD domain-containing protein
MKPERVEMSGVDDLGTVVERVVQTRLREVRGLCTGLEQRDKESLHAFRIACKRLRYALERFGALDPSLERIAAQLARLQDALGETHDRDVLLAILPPTMAETQRRLQSERDACIDQAFALWRGLEQEMQALDSHLF